ncbi:RNA polymerase sigma factor [Streptacidiphilus sp. ASG 303]|uniref:RNA polymerase sigma factor n=1 Tax=Streptomycetaceae TaxID=2062 RepID=UPI001E38ABD2|nr:RNA polymerase sigma factor [Streptacidiphilus sp. ASG 303]MCD0486157.1 RNA polymerase sigma factor [Streptacidiphilus sp. ASG 303]
MPDERLLDDRLLAVRAAEGDDDAFAELVRRHSGTMLALAHRMLGSRPDAEDAVQDAFVSAWRRLPEFRHDSAFGTWMYRIVTNRCLNALRSRPPAVRLEDVPEPPASGGLGAPARTAEADAAMAALAEALQRLSPEQRACWVLRELHGLPYEEIAHVTDTSEQAVRGRLFRARRALTEVMSPWR